ncbi:MAG: transglycosylase domain-containing protein [Candidatus Dojkabacteria bacterium]|nr:transglycosylase domain-containing protein [Candidatus Dojkabacteria bacterium]
MKYSVGLVDRNRKSPAPRRVLRRPSFLKYSGFKKFGSKNIKNRKSGITTKGKREKKEGPLKKKLKKAFYILVGILFFIGCIGLIVIGLYLKGLQNSLPSPDQLVERKSDQSTQIFDRNEQLLYTIYGDQNREFVSIDKVPEYTKWAVLAAEDIEFYQHKGIDYAGIARAALQNLTAGTVVRGASTITQQLVKTTLLFDILGEEAYRQTYTRKIKEILITMQVEQTFSKDEILQMYMNEIPLGGVNYGFQAAANAYFGKNVDELTLAESALIAGLIQSPGIYSPLYGTNPDLAEMRQDYVLDQMLKHKNLTGVTEEEIEAAKAEELEYKTRRIDIKAPHFVFYVKSLLEKEFGVDRVERGGLKVTTTLDYSLQEIAEEEIIKGVTSGKRYNVNNGSMVVIDPNNGQILAMVGSVDYWNTEDPRVDGNVNIAVSERQMGSSVKPFVYLTAITQGYGPWTLAPDLKEITFGKYDPKNWDSKNIGLLTARKALVESRNVSAVYMLQLAGIDAFLQTMQKVGVTTLSNRESYGLSLALGSGEEKLLEHTAGFAVFATGGIKRDVVSILKVEDSKGEIIKEVEENEGQRVFDEKDVYLLNWILCDLGGMDDRPNNAKYKIGGQRICAKTGTTDGPKDLTTVMYHKNLVVGVWNGNNNNKIMPGAWGSIVPLSIANSFMTRVQGRYKPVVYNRPAGVLSTTVCKDTGATPADGVNCSKEASVYISGKAPQTDNRKVYTICTANNLIPDNLDLAVKYGLTTDKIVLSTTLENPYQRGAYEKYLLGMKNSVYLADAPATGTCPLPLGPDNAPMIDMSQPVNGQKTERGKNLELVGSVTVLQSVASFSAKFDGVPIIGASLNSNGTFVINYFVDAATSLGNHTVTVSVTDNLGKSATKSVTVEVIENVSGITVSMSAPSNGATVTSPVTLSATVSGGTVDNVSFYISKVGGGYTKTLTDSSDSGGWSAVWSNGATAGQYTIVVKAVKSGITITGNSISITLN